MKNTTNHLEDNIHRGLIVAVLFLLLLSSACIGMGSKPKLSIKDLTIDKQEKRSIWSSFCSVDIKGLIIIYISIYSGVNYCFKDQYKEMAEVFDDLLS